MCVISGMQRVDTQGVVSNQEFRGPSCNVRPRAGAWSVSMVVSIMFVVQTAMNRSMWNMTHCVLCVSTLGLSDITDNQISRVFPLCISILQVIENWRPISLCFHNYRSKLHGKRILATLCIRPQSSVPSLYGRFKVQWLPFKEGTELGSPIQLSVASILQTL